MNFLSFRTNVLYFCVVVSHNMQLNFMLCFISLIALNKAWRVGRRSLKYTNRWVGKNAEVSNKWI